MLKDKGKAIDSLKRKCTSDEFTLHDTVHGEETALNINIYLNYHRESTIMRESIDRSKVI